MREKFTIAWWITLERARRMYLALYTTSLQSIVTCLGMAESARKPLLVLSSEIPKGQGSAQSNCVIKHHNGFQGMRNASRWIIWILNTYISLINSVWIIIITNVDNRRKLITSCYVIKLGRGKNTRRKGMSYKHCHLSIV